MIPDAVAQNPVTVALIARYADVIEEGHDKHGELTLVVNAGKILEVCRHLKDVEKFVRCSSLTAVDWYPREPRFEIVYHLQSVERKLWLRIKARVGGEQPE